MTSDFRFNDSLQLKTGSYAQFSKIVKWREIIHQNETFLKRLAHELHFEWSYNSFFIIETNILTSSCQILVRGSNLKKGYFEERK